MSTAGALQLHLQGDKPVHTRFAPQPKPGQGVTCGRKWTTPPSWYLLGPQGRTSLLRTPSALCGVRISLPSCQDTSITRKASHLKQGLLSHDCYGDRCL